MISTPDRQASLQLIDAARAQGARLVPACAELGVDVRTDQRWRRLGAGGGVDRRTERSQTQAGHALSTAEVQQVLALCNSPEYASLPPAQIVAREVDQGRFIASESSFYRILRRHHQNQPRGRANPKRVARPKTHRASAPNQVWSDDVTWLPGPVTGLFYYLCLIIDIYSRKVVAWEVEARESAGLAERVVQQAVLKERCIGKPLVLHADNGSPLKASSLKAKLKALNITPSHSRPRVSNDNPFVESLFGTCKAMPSFPHKGFATLAEAPPLSA